MTDLRTRLLQRRDRIEQGRSLEPPVTVTAAFFETTAVARKRQCVGCRTRFTPGSNESKCKACRDAERAQPLLR